MRIRKILIEELMGAPWWISAILAMACFIAATILPEINTGMIPLGEPLAMLAKIFGFVFAFTALISFIISLLKGNIFKFGLSLEEIKNLSWKEFEYFIGEYYRQKDYSVVQGEDGPDGGIDLIAKKNGEKIVIQCKHWKAYKVDVKIARELYGVMVDESTSKAALITTGEFTVPALDFAEDKPIELIDGEKLIKLISQVKKKKVKKEIKKPIKDEVKIVPEKKEKKKYDERDYMPLEIKEEFKDGFSDEFTDITPKCPYCEKPMVLRMAKRGAHPGQKFWGCQNDPKCTHTESYEANKI